MPSASLPLKRVPWFNLAAARRSSENTEHSRTGIGVFILRNDLADSRRASNPWPSRRCFGLHSRTSR